MQAVCVRLVVPLVLVTRTRYWPHCNAGVSYLGWSSSGTCLSSVRISLRLRFLKEISSTFVFFLLDSELRGRWVNQTSSPPSGGNSYSCVLLSPEILSSRDVSASTCDISPSLSADCPPSGHTLEMLGGLSAFCAFDGAVLSVGCGGGCECWIPVCAASVSLCES